MKCPQARQSVRNQPRMIGPSSATVIHTQPDPAHPGNDPQPADPSTFRSLASDPARWWLAGWRRRRQHRSHEPPPARERNPPCTRSPPPRGTRRHARRVPRQPGQEPAQGAGDPTGCSSGAIKVANDIPVGRPNNCDGCGALLQPRCRYPGPEPPNNAQQHRTPRWAGRLLNPTPDAVDRG